MANQQIFPNSSYPGAGDLQTSPGDPNTTVVGIQTVPVLSQYPLNGQILIYDQTINAYVPAHPIVSGPDPVGTSPSVNPVQVSGIDDGDLVRELRTDTYGGIRSVNMEELLLQILLELRAIKAAIISDKFVDDSELSPDNFTDAVAGA